MPFSEEKTSSANNHQSSLDRNKKQTEANPPSVRTPKRCTQCVLTEHFPKISFDTHGVCSYCHAFDARWKDWNLAKPETELFAILDRARRKNPQYQCLVGISGGKDSCYALHLLVKKYHARVLAITYDNGFLSDGARNNIELMIKKLGIEHRYVTRDPELTRRMVRALIKKNCSDLCMICMNGVASAFNRLAIEENIPVLAWANSTRADSVMPMELINFFDYRFMIDVMKPHIGSRI